MNFCKRSWIVILFTQVCALQVVAQVSAQPTTNLPSAYPTETNRPVTITGRIVLEDGTPLAEPVEVQRVCGNLVRGDVFSDSKGKFTILLDDKSNSSFQSASEGGGLTNMGAQMGGRTSQTTRTQLWGCEVRAVLPGYVSSTISLEGMDFSAPVNLNPIVMRRSSGSAGNSISAVALKAPKDARAEFDKARDDFSNKKYESAEKHLTKAIEKYPGYASAYNLRGRAFRALRKDDEAEKDFTAAINADKDYVPPYLHLAALHATRGNWNDVVRLSDQAIALDDHDYAEPYYFKSVAYLKLNDVRDAHQNLVKVLEIDKEHHFPRAELILGNILRAQHDDAGARAHYENYVRFEPNGADAAKVQEYLREAAQSQKK